MCIFSIPGWLVLCTKRLQNQGYGALKYWDTRRAGCPSKSNRCAFFCLKVLDQYFQTSSHNLKLDDMSLNNISILYNKIYWINSELKKKTGAYRENFWTSGTVQNKYDPLLTWDSTGRLLWQYTNFGSSQINGSTTGYCLVMNYLDEFKWYETGCQTENLRYICEKKG